MNFNARVGEIVWTGVEAKPILAVAFDEVGEVKFGTWVVAEPIRALIDGNFDAGIREAAHDQAVFGAGIVNAPFFIVGRPRGDDVRRVKFEGHVVAGLLDDAFLIIVRAEIRTVGLNDVSVAGLAFVITGASFRELSACASSFC